MALLSPVSGSASHIWLVDLNPLGLEEPPTWWQQLVFDYDKMLRVMPSQREHVYRLCRLVRQEARLGLSQMVVHDHPDTRAMIKFGVVPIASLAPWAIRSNKIIRDLHARDTWRHHGGDVSKIVDDLEAAEAKTVATEDAEKHAELDEINSSVYRSIRYGRPTQVDLGQHAADDLQWPVWNGTVQDHRRVTPLPPLPPLMDLQKRDRVESVSPPEGTVAPLPRIVLTDS